MKGQDADKEAIEQIEQTVKKLSKNKSIKLGYIVHTSSRKPAIDTSIQKGIKGLKKSHNTILRLIKTPCTETIEELLKIGR